MSVRVNVCEYICVRMYECVEVCVMYGYVSVCVSIDECESECVSACVLSEYM